MNRKEDQSVEQHELDHEQEPFKFPRWLIIIVAVFMIFLMVFFVFSSYPISNIIVGQLQSSPLQDNILDVGDFKIFFLDGTEEILEAYYFSEQKVEFSLCLQGEIKDNDYYIDSLYQPEQFQQSFSHVSFAPCSADSLIILHTHPYKSCVASETDLATLEKTQQNNPNVLMVVMCEPRRFSVYN